MDETEAGRIQVLENTVRQLRRDLRRIEATPLKTSGGTFWAIALASLRSLASSKKALVTLAGCSVVLARKLGLDIDEETMNQLMTFGAALILGIGLQDFGKEAARVQAASAAASAEAGPQPPE